MRITLGINTSPVTVKVERFERPRSSRPFRVALGVLALAVFGGFSFYSIENWRGEIAWQHFLKQVAARGGATDLRALIPPPVPDGENFCKIPLFEKEGYRQFRPGAPPAPSVIQGAAALINWNAIGSFRAGTWTRLDTGTASNTFVALELQADTARKVLSSFEPYRAQMDELRTAARRKYSRFDTDGTFTGPMPNFVLLRTISQSFAYHALAELLAGNPEGAFEDLRVVQRLIDGLEGHPTLISAMIRVAISGLNKQPFYEGWARGQWTDAHYREFHDFFARADFLKNLDRAMQGGERLGVAQLIVSRSTRELTDDFNLSGVDETKEPVRAMLVTGFFRSLPKGWWFQNLVYHHRVLDQMLTQTYDVGGGRVFPRGCTNANELVQQMASRVSPFNVVAAAAIPNMSKAVQTMTRAQTTSDQAQLVCALERYWLAKGQYPSNLQELVPDFAVSLPRDLVSGEPPIYGPLEKGGFRLYSVGWDGKDDGGGEQPETVEARDFENGDFIWPYEDR